MAKKMNTGIVVIVDFLGLVSQADWQKRDDIVKKQDILFIIIPGEKLPKNGE